MSAVHAAAYGFRFAGLPPTPWLAVEGAEDWPVVRVGRPSGVPGSVATTPDQGRAAVDARHPLDIVVHPALGHVGLAFAAAHGRDALHAGAVAGPLGAWAVVGTKEAGKSTLMAAAARAGTEVLTDDVLVLDAGRALAGPRCVDLRRAPPDVHESALVRTGGRWRITLPPCPADRPLTGVVHLAWGPEPELLPLRPSEGLARIAERQRLDGWPRDPSVALGLAGLPTYELRRPRDLARAGESLALLVGLVEAGDGALRSPGG